jgi:redox-sensitive bicupin YhaK (pirin superfamily)
MGLQTVTWLLAGELRHRDSLGSEQTIHPGQLNLMTAGRGVSHAEEATGSYYGPTHGIQLWVAQPSETRDGLPGFEHHPELPALDFDNARATVLVGELADVVSPARRDTDHVGLDLALRGGITTIPVDPTHEFGLIVFEGGVSVAKNTITPGHLAYLGPGPDRIELETLGPSRALLLGGTPFPEQLFMWWNFVARTPDEIDAAQRDWATDSGRFGTVSSHLARIEVDPPSWTSRH